MLHLAKNIPGARGPAPGEKELADKVAALNARYRHHSATPVIQAPLAAAGHTALVSSFGPESIPVPSPHLPLPRKRTVKTWVSAESSKKK